MKILITTGIFPPDIGGPASYGKILAQTLADNFSVSLITYSSKSKFPEDKNQPFKIIRIAKWIPRFLRHFVFFAKVFFAAGKADVIFSLNAVSAGLPALWAAKIRRKKFFVKVVGDYAWEIAVGKGKTFLLIDDFQKSKRRGWIGALHKYQTKVCRGADRVIVPSKYLANLVKNWGVPEEKIRVVYNGTNFKPLGISREEARKKIGISGNIIISVGRLVPWKGFRMLIKIMPQLLRINQFFRLVVIGDGPDYEILKNMVQNLGLEKEIYLVGKKPQDELKLYLAAADIFVLNSGYEGFSHQILEAMSVGVPVVTTTAGGNREIIKQGENGFMIKYNDEFNLVEAIKTIWQIPELCTRFIEEGRKTAEHFSSEKMIEETIKILTE